MKILVDTHILLWSLEGGNQLSELQKQLLLDEENMVFASQITLMEIAIKMTLGKLGDYGLTCEQIFQQWKINNFEWLDIKNEHLFAYHQIPFFDDHRDPFDRFLVATAYKEDHAFMTSDTKFHHYSHLVRLV